MLFLSLEIIISRCGADRRELPDSPTIPAELSRVQEQPRKGLESVMCGGDPELKLPDIYTQTQQVFKFSEINYHRTVNSDTW
jgi:hypothetical protein